MNFRNLSECCSRKGRLSEAIVRLTSLQTTSFLNSFSTYRLEQINEQKSLNKALRVIDIVTPKHARVRNHESHLKVIQDILQTHSKHSIDVRIANDLTSLDCETQKPSNKKYSCFSANNKDPTLRVLELHRQGLNIDVALLSHALSACACRGDISCGTQFHCLSVRGGFFANVYVGSSLISMYSKCGDPHSGLKVFEDMPVRNVVTWTTLISGFAQDCQFNICLKLYSSMCDSDLKPNEYTLTSLLSACVGSGSLVQGKSVHCQAVTRGADSYLHVANALISMYCKCGNVEDASWIFQAMNYKDIVTWNSMIAGYALHGLAQEAVDLYENMKQLKIKPDGITFLGVLSSCRHAGLVDQGWVYFNSMLENGLTPNLSHYSCIVDLLGRAGLLEQARNFILEMPIQPNAIIWGSVLSSCRLHNEVWIGIEAAENRLALEPSCAATYLQLVKLYSKVGLWDQVAKVWKLMKETEVKTNCGYSWIEIGSEVYSFSVNDTSNPRMNEIILILNSLMDHLAVSYSVEELDEESDAYSSISL